MKWEERGGSAGGRGICIYVIEREREREGGHGSVRQGVRQPDTAPTLSTFLFSKWIYFLSIGTLCWREAVCCRLRIAENIPGQVSAIIQGRVK